MRINGSTLPEAINIRNKTLISERSLFRKIQESTTGRLTHRENRSGVIGQKGISQIDRTSDAQAVR